MFNYCLLIFSVGLLWALFFCSIYFIHLHYFSVDSQTCWLFFLLSRCDYVVKLEQQLSQLPGYEEVKGSNPEAKIALFEPID